MKREPCTEQIVVRLPPSLHEQITALADAEQRTLSNMTRIILQRWAAERNSRQAA